MITFCEKSCLMILPEVYCSCQKQKIGSHTFRPTDVRRTSYFQHIIVSRSFSFPDITSLTPVLNSSFTYLFTSETLCQTNHYPSLRGRLWCIWMDVRRTSVGRPLDVRRTKSVRSNLLFLTWAIDFGKYHMTIFFTEYNHPMFCFWMTTYSKKVY